jgi:glycosyltransferase involved in cell wall biosynthesis
VAAFLRLRSLRERVREVKLKQILLISAYHAGSHRYWCEALMRQFPEVGWTLLTLPARHFAWRIRGNPLSLLHEYSEQLAGNYDLCIATSMVDLATLRGLVPQLAATRCLLYFHENQFAYPVSSRQHQSLEPQMVNLYAALAADQILFNSEYNRSSFLAGVEGLMLALPDYTPQNLAARLREKSAVLPVPLELPAAPVARKPQTAIPKLLWNHRWEYDKGPALLLSILQQLHAEGVPLRLAIIGQQFRTAPPEFAEIQTLLAQSQTLQLEQWGYVEEVARYRCLLAESDIVLSTADHDFQGLAVLEAVAAGCTPVVPDALAYPEWFPPECRYGKGEAVRLIRRLLEGGGERPVPDLRFLGWETLKPRYAVLLESLLS